MLSEVAVAWWFLGALYLVGWTWSRVRTQYLVPKWGDPKVSNLEYVLWLALAIGVGVLMSSFQPPVEQAATVAVATYWSYWLANRGSHHLVYWKVLRTPESRKRYGVAVSVAGTVFLFPGLVLFTYTVAS